MTFSETVVDSGSGTRWSGKKLLWSMLGVATLLRLSVLSGPVPRDEGLFGYIAQEVMRGHLPLETVLDNKGPLFFYLYSLGLLFGIDSIEGIRLVGTLMVLAFAWVFYILVKALKDQRFALMVLALMLLHSSFITIESFYYGTELFALLPTTLSGLFAWRAVRRGSARDALMAGIFLGLGVWIRLTVITLVLSFAGFMVLCAKGRSRLTYPLAFGVGMLLASVPILGLYGYHGQLQVLYEANFTFSAVQATIGDSFISPWQTFVFVSQAVLPSTFGLYLIAIAAFFGGLGRTLERPAQIFAVLWLVGALIGFVAPMQYLIKHLFLFYPPVCVLAGCTLYDLLRPGKVGKNRLSLGLIGAMLAIEIAVNVGPHLAMVRGDYSKESPLTIKAGLIGEWLKVNAAPQSTIYNWGVEWPLYFISAHRSPTRQVSALFLVSLAVAVDRGAPLADEFAAAQKEVVDAFEANPPEFFILTAGLKTYDLPNFTVPTYLEKQLLTNYDLLYQDEPFWVFRRKGSNAGPPPAEPKATASPRAGR